MAVEYLQGELLRVTRTIDLQESLVNGRADEFAGTQGMVKSPQISADIRGSKISRESTQKTRIQFDSCSFAQIRG
jgi:hypothetical protein